MKLRVFGKNQKGFTLIEMMVVASIASILVVLAVPQYSKYQSISKQAQAKVLLSSMWVAEQSFSLQTGSYTQCLSDIGVSASAANPLQYYGFGIDAAHVAGNQCGPNQNQDCMLTVWDGTGSDCAPGDTYFTAAINMYHANTHLPSTGDLYPNHVTAPTSYLTYNTFFAMAVGSISTTSSPYDRWSIDQTKSISNDTPSL